MKTGLKMDVRFGSGGPTPDPSQEGIRQDAVRPPDMRFRFTSWEGSGVGRRASRSSRGFATLAVLMLAFALVVLIIGLSRFLSVFRADVRRIETKQQARVGTVETNRPSALPTAEE